MSSVRIVLADDHPMYRYGVAAVLADEPRVDLVEQATTGAELLQLVTAARPDVVVTDMRMPDLSGIEVTRALLETDPDLPVLVLTSMTTMRASMAHCAPAPADTFSRAPTPPSWSPRCSPWLRAVRPSARR